jgi:hypothetical protein
MKKRKTKLEIINETAAYYMEDPSRRAVTSDDTCKYLTGDGRMCAVGRCFTKKGRDKYGNIMGSYNYSMHKFMRAEYAHIDDEDFWLELQRFHDGEYYWNDKGITLDGIRCLNGLRVQYTE